MSRAVVRLGAALLALWAPFAAHATEAPSGRAFTLRVVSPELGRSRAAALEPRQIRVPAGDGRAALVIDVKPDASAHEAWDLLHRVGTVTVRRAGSSTPHQTIRVHSRADATWFAPNCALVDVNFDGHPDLVTLAEQGATWGRWNVRLYRPRQGRFVRTPLTRDIARLRASSLTFDAATRTLTTRQLAPGLDRTYSVRSRSLRRTSAVRLTPSAE